MTGFEALQIELEWQWVAVHDGRVVAQLLAAHAHQLLLILRLTALPDAPPGTVLRLLRGVMREAKARGLVAYLTFLSDQTGAEVKLMRIIQRHDGYFQPFTGVVAAGRVEVDGCRQS